MDKEKGLSTEQRTYVASLAEKLITGMAVIDEAARQSAGRTTQQC